MDTYCYHYWYYQILLTLSWSCWRHLLLSTTNAYSFELFSISFPQVDICMISCREFYFTCTPILPLNEYQIVILSCRHTMENSNRTVHTYPRSLHQTLCTTNQSIQDYLSSLTNIFCSLIQTHNQSESAWDEICAIAREIMPHQFPKSTLFANHILYVKPVLLQAIESEVASNKDSQDFTKAISIVRNERPPGAFIFGQLCHLVFGPLSRPQASCGL